MADFQVAIKIVLDHEGTYANRHGDKGGETYCGIARNKHPEWAGWKIVDELRDRGNFPAILDKQDYLQKLVVDFYFDEFWLKVNAPNIKSQKVANKLMDMAVLMGPNRAVVCLQRSLFSCGYVDKISSIDGIIGERTMYAVNNAAEYIVLPSFKSECAGYLRGLNDEININGWIKRAYS